MSVEREESITRFTCDGEPLGKQGTCRANYEGVDGFVSAWTEAKAHGWVNVPFSGERAAWKHYCPTCKLELGDD